MKKLFLLVALLVAAPAVFAQDYYGLPDYGLSKNTTRIEFYGGLAMPQNAWKDKIGTTGWTAGIGFQRNVLNFLSFGVDGNYTQFGDGDRTADKQFLRTGVATGLVTGRVSFFPSQATRIYIPAGVGLGHVFTTAKQTSGDRITYNGTDLAAMIGVGLEFDMDEDFIFGVEARYYMVKTADEVKDNFGKNKMHFTNLMLKFGYRF